MKDDTISRRSAIEVASRECHEFRGIFANIERGLKELPTEGREKQKEPCSICKSLENGDTLYSMSDWDGGIGFDYIRDIEYCPVCGRKL